jgi:Protein of unknown function (DUF2786)
MTATTAPLTHEERRAKITKIRALRAKTVARGCTAEEAESARLLADKLQAKYGLTDEECQPEPARVRSDFGSWFWDTMRRAGEEEARRAQQDHQPRADGHRKNPSHAHCDHEATSSARAKCRRNGGPS